ncbi:hypothetical protein BPC006_I1160 [Burkholderia pseudomallei BPC006]|nr:hypothetical protein BPC006_I1160 [Burkholderia pseudomallei BPC006]
MIKRGSTHSGLQKRKSRLGKRLRLRVSGGY